ncbi:MULTISPECIES: hypothetical protein [unclassified Microcoleus]
MAHSLLVDGGSEVRSESDRLLEIIRDRAIDAGSIVRTKSPSSVKD